MHGKGEDLRFVAKNPGGSIPLMHIQVHNQDPIDQAFGLQNPGGDRQIVEDAKPGAKIGEGVVRAARQIASQPMAQGQPSR